MALLFVDGFDAGDTAVKWTLAWAGSRSTDTRFNSGSSWHVAPIGAYLYRSFTPINQIFVGFAAKFATATSQIDFFRVMSDSGATTHLILRYSTTGVLQLVKGDGTILSSTPTAPFTFSWSNYYEMSATIADSGGTCEVRVNGQTVMTYTGDTKNAGTATTIDRIQFNTGGGTGNPTVMIDDLYMNDATGSAPHNTFLGDVRINTLTPSGAGSSTQMTPSTGANYTTVDELPYSATDYVQGSAGQTDLYTATDLPSTTGTIFGVQANAIAKKTDAGALTAHTVIKSGGTTSNGSNVNLPTTDAIISTPYTVNPDTSTAWTQSTVNGLEIGIGAS